MTPKQSNFPRKYTFAQNDIHLFESFAILLLKTFIIINFF